MPPFGSPPVSLALGEHTDVRIEVRASREGSGAHFVLPQGYADQPTSPLFQAKVTSRTVGASAESSSRR